MLYSSRSLSVSINCAPARAYAFIVNPENLPRWATGFCKSVKQVNGQWIVETTLGPMAFRFVERNNLGVLDHYVTVPPGIEVYVPLRVLPNGSGSEVVLTLFRARDMSDRQFAEDASLVERDLRTLKRVLEQAPSEDLAR